MNREVRGPEVKTLVSLHRFVRCPVYGLVSDKQTALGSDGHPLVQGDDGRSQRDLLIR